MSSIKIESRYRTWSKNAVGKSKGKKKHLLENDRLAVLSDEIFDFDCLTNPEAYSKV